MKKTPQLSSIIRIFRCQKICWHSLVKLITSYIIFWSSFWQYSQSFRKTYESRECENRLKISGLINTFKGINCTALNDALLIFSRFMLWAQKAQSMMNSTFQKFENVFVEIQNLANQTNCYSHHFFIHLKERIQSTYDIGISLLSFLFTKAGVRWFRLLIL